MVSGSNSNNAFPYNVENDGALFFKRKALEGEAIDRGSNLSTYLPTIRQSKEHNSQIGIGHGVKPDVFPSISVTETGESSSRTYNIRANHDNDWINLPSTRNVMSLSEFRARSQMIHTRESMHTPKSSRNVPLFSFHASRNLRGGESLTSASAFITAKRGVLSREEFNLESFMKNSVELSPFDSWPEGTENSKKEMPKSGCRFRSRIIQHWNIVLPPTLRSVSSSREILGRRERVNWVLTRAYLYASTLPSRATGAVKILFILTCLIGKIYSQPNEVQNLTALNHTLPSERHKNFQSKVSLGLGLGIGLGLGLLIIVCCFILYIAHKHNVAQAAQQAAQQAELELQMVQQTLACRAFVESFPVYSLLEEGTDVEECPICVVAFEEGSNLMLLPLCGHVFHRECMVNYWRGLAEERPCPLCRRDYKMWQPDVESG